MGIGSTAHNGIAAVTLGDVTVVSSGTYLIAASTMYASCQAVRADQTRLICTAAIAAATTAAANGQSSVTVVGLTPAAVAALQSAHYTVVVNGDLSTVSWA